MRSRRQQEQTVGGLSRIIYRQVHNRNVILETIIGSKRRHKGEKRPYAKQTKPPTDQTSKVNSKNRKGELLLQKGRGKKKETSKRTLHPWPTNKRSGRASLREIPFLLLLLLIDQVSEWEGKEPTILHVYLTYNNNSNASALLIMVRNKEKKGERVRGYHLGFQNRKVEKNKESFKKIRKKARNISRSEEGKREKRAFSKAHLWKGVRRILS